MFHDLTFLQTRFRDLQNLLPPHSLHAVAVKANPLNRLLELLRDLGAGAEAASPAELDLAVRAGYPAERIVFDSPVKTTDDLRRALELGVNINADSIDELKRLAELVTITPPRGAIGIRINPQVGTGTISSSSVAGEYSKFGVPLGYYRRDVIDCFLRYKWLRGVHIHIGSQGCPLELLVGGVKRMVEFVMEVNQALADHGAGHRVEVVDIGGGLPVSYHKDRTAASLEDYWSAVEPLLSRLDPPPRSLITEFGRYIHANAGWTVSRVEYVKTDPDLKTAMIHVGADLLLRRCYRPEDWHHEISVTDSSGRLKSGLDTTPYVIAGPLCFAGDVIAQGIRLPVIEPGDYVIIHDTGAYTMSMWSRYNSRQAPKVIGYHDDGAKFEFLRERESLDDIADFWS